MMSLSLEFKRMINQLCESFWDRVSAFALPDLARNGTVGSVALPGARQHLTSQIFCRVSGQPLLSFALIAFYFFDDSRKCD
ncbi:hypothetical protein [Paraburkholderia tuberum]|uniref:hypothetical protein n=1 Tax=Paraburkholderia tuberum TaxID=157910 RepID=UPI001ABBE633|nr:hypothetical protein [Paraburkholderia tuberum]